LASYTNPRTGNTKGCTDNKLDCFTTNHNDDDLIINAPSHLLSGTKYYITFIWYHTTKPKASYTKCCTHYIITYYSKMNQAFTIEHRNVIVLDDTTAPPPSSGWRKQVSLKCWY